MLADHNSSVKVSIGVAGSIMLLMGVASCRLADSLDSYVLNEDAGSIEFDIGGDDDASDSHADRKEQRDADGSIQLSDADANPESPDVDAPASSCISSDVPGLHGCSESLDNGRVRIHYDFEDADQLLDWRRATRHQAEPYVVSGELVVPRAPGIVPITLIYPVIVESLQFTASVIAGNHINFYVDTSWDGEWNPSTGIGGIHRETGRLLVVDRNRLVENSPPGIERHVKYQVTVTLTDEEFTWDSNGSIETARFDPPRTRSADRTVFLGGFGSTVAFDDIVIVGTIAH